MRYALITAALCITPVLASADPQPTKLGPVVGGITLYLNADGTLNFSTDDTIHIADGRTLKRLDGDKWTLSTNDATKTFTPMDLGLYGRDYIGSRISVANVRLYGATIRGGIIDLPGNADASVSFDGLDRERIRILVDTCGGIETRCNFDLTATLGVGGIGEFSLIDPVFSLPAKTSLKTVQTHH